MTLLRNLFLFSFLQYYSTYNSTDNRRKTEGPGIQKGLDAIASSLNYIGGTIGKSLEVDFCSLVSDSLARVCFVMLCLLTRVLCFGGDFIDNCST